MNVVTYSAFKNEIEKISSGWGHAAELGGLGMLAYPSIQHLRGKGMSEKNKSRAEVAGLGILAAPTAVSVAKKGLGALRKIKRGSAEPQLVDGALSLFKTSSSAPGQIIGRTFGMGAGNPVLDTARRTVAKAAPSLQARMAARAAQLKGIALKANPVKTLPSSGLAIRL